MNHANRSTVSNYFCVSVLFFAGILYIVHENEETGSKWSLVILAVSTFTMFLEVGIIKGFDVLLPTSTQTWMVGSSVSIIRMGVFDR